MIELATARDVRARLSLRDDDGVNTSIESCLEGARTYLREALSTTFERGTASDVFWISPTTASPVRGRYTLRTRQGFLVSSSVRYAECYTEAEVLEATATLTPSFFDADLGMVKVSDAMKGRYVRVSYDYGFQTDDDVPGWLKEVCITYTCKLLATQQLSDKGNNGIAEVYDFITKHGGTILTPHLRNRSEAIVPL